MEVKKNRVYRHFKGDYFLVIDFAMHSETGEKLVLYRALYGDGAIHAGPYEMFCSFVDKEKYPEVEQRYRFELQEIKSVKER